MAVDSVYERKWNESRMYAYAEKLKVKKGSRTNKTEESERRRRSWTVICFTIVLNIGKDKQKSSPSRKTMIDTV